MKTRKQGAQVSGWQVYAGTNKPGARHDFDLAWSAISQKFTVRPAAELFRELAQRDMPEAVIEVRALYVEDGIGN